MAAVREAGEIGVTVFRAGSDVGSFAGGGGAVAFGGSIFTGETGGLAGVTGCTGGFGGGSGSG